MPRWTPEAREKQRQLIQSWSPWETSTGPTTPEGKAKASRNAAQTDERLWIRECKREVERYSNNPGYSSKLITKRGRIVGYEFTQTTDWGGCFTNRRIRNF